jgi:hypothetical protein
MRARMTLVGQSAKRGAAGMGAYTRLKGAKGGGRCTARTKRGTPCRAWAAEGFTRCRHHHGLCRALTKSGMPCRGGKLRGTGRCKWHGAFSTGPRTAEGKAKVALNLPRIREARARERSVRAMVPN